MILRALLAGLAGVGLALSFQPVGWWWLAVPSLAVLIAVAFRARPGAGFLLGVVFGAGAYVPLLRWLGAVIGPDAGLALSLYSALWIGLAGAGIALVTRLTGWWLWVPAVWVLVEAVGGRVPLGGWGWGRVGFSQDSSVLLPWASVAGVPGLSLLVLLLASCLVAVAADPLRRAAPRMLHRAAPGLAAASPAPGRSRPAIAPAVVAASVLLGGLLIPLPTHAQSAAGPAQRQVGVVQGGVPQAGLDFNAQRRAVLDNHVRATLRLAQEHPAGSASAPDLVIWPENASDIDPYRNADARAAIEAAAAAVAVPILVGAVVDDPGDDRAVRNQGIVWDPITGPGEAYTKQNLVPFGEYVPFRSVLAGAISRFDRVPRDFVPGQESGALDIGGTRIGDAICFDVAYDDALRGAVRDGARMLVVQTNNATYNGTAQPWQQFAMSRIRAVEHGRAVAVVATSGLSGVIAPDGTVVPGTQLGELASGSYAIEVAQRDALTVADRLGAWPELLVLLVGAAALVAVAVGRVGTGEMGKNGTGEAPTGVVGPPL